MPTMMMTILIHRARDQLRNTRNRRSFFSSSSALSVTGRILPQPQWPPLHFLLPLSSAVPLRFQSLRSPNNGKNNSRNILLPSCSASNPVVRYYSSTPTVLEEDERDTGMRADRATKDSEDEQNKDKSTNERRNILSKVMSRRRRHSSSSSSSHHHTTQQGMMNHTSDPHSRYAKYLTRWTLLELIHMEQLVTPWAVAPTTTTTDVEDDVRTTVHQQDRHIAATLVDFMKRIEINSERLITIQEIVEDIYGRLHTLKSNKRGKDTQPIQAMLLVLEDERKTLRNLQALHFDTWETTWHQYKQYSPDGDDDIDNDAACLAPTDEVLIDPVARYHRWESLLAAATEIQARHALTIEAMAEIVIRMKPLSRTYGCPQDTVLTADDHESFQKDLVQIYDTICAFMRCRMTQQLLCQHLMALGQHYPRPTGTGSSDTTPTTTGTSGTSMSEQEPKAIVAAAAVAAGPSYNSKKKSDSNYEENHTNQVVAKKKKTVGVINVDTPVITIVREAVEEAEALCDATYDVAPSVSYVIACEDLRIVHGDGKKAYESITNQTRTTEDIHETTSATFVRAWFQYTMIELLKNAMAATVDNNPDIVTALTTVTDDDDDDDDETKSSPPQQLPTLYVHIFDSPCGDYILIRIHDQGGGIPEHLDLERCFHFAQRDTVWDRLDEQQTSSQSRDPLRGLGVGLSLSRWHMQHFGGDLTLERRPANAIRVRGTTGRRSKWYTLARGMTATIRIPKNADIPLAIS